VSTEILGIDESTRESLSFIPGCVPADLGEFSENQILPAARLLRAMHDATTDCPLRGNSEVVCHGDASPCNCVFVEGIPFAFIDFDAAHAGSRFDDLGYAAWLWLDIGNVEISPARQGKRLVAFFAAYGAETHEAVTTLIEAQSKLASRAGAPLGAREWAEKCREWTVLNRAHLFAACSNKTIEPTR
jgi:aminoglycoside phosphotransferase (APT) family kinase protein